MTEQEITALKARFRAGGIVTQQDYEALIDAIDSGSSSSSGDGLKQVDLSTYASNTDSEIVQHVGSTDSTYTHGYIYERKKIISSGDTLYEVNGENYSLWDNNVPEGSFYRTSNIAEKASSGVDYASNSSYDSNTYGIASLQHPYNGSTDIQFGWGTNLNTYPITLNRPFIIKNISTGQELSAVEYNGDVYVETPYYYENSGTNYHTWDLLLTTTTASDVFIWERIDVQPKAKDLSVVIDVAYGNQYVYPVAPDSSHYTAVTVPDVINSWINSNEYTSDGRDYPFPYPGLKYSDIRTVTIINDCPWWTEESLYIKTIDNNTSGGAPDNVLITEIPRGTAASFVKIDNIDYYSSDYGMREEYRWRPVAGAKIITEYELSQKAQEASGGAS